MSNVVSPDKLTAGIARTHLGDHDRNGSVVLVPVYLVTDVLPRARDIVPMIVWHDMRVDEIALRENLLSHWT